MEKKIVLDLCSGLGGFSQAFKDDPNWEVITIDIESKFHPVMCVDIVDVVNRPAEYPDFWMLRPDLILASPPCERFSFAANTFPRSGIFKAMQVVGACLEIIAKMQPKGWILEHPRARLRWFLGVPNLSVRLSQFGYRTVKPTDFWTNIDIGLLKDVPRVNKKGIKFDSMHGSKNRALLPYGLSKLIKTVAKVIK